MKHVKREETTPIIEIVTAEVFIVIESSISGKLQWIPGKWKGKLERLGQNNNNEIKVKPILT